MKNSQSSSLRFRLFEYVTTLAMGSLLLAVVVQTSMKDGPLFAIALVLPICLGALTILFSFHYFRRFFVAKDSGTRIAQSIGLAIMSSALSIPLSMWFAHIFWSS